MKVSIIGGGGLVGSCTAFALQTGAHRARHCAGRRQRRLGRGPGARPAARQPAGCGPGDHAGGYEQIPDSDLICITAGLRRKPDESRLDLINRNVDLFLGILDEVKPRWLIEATRSCWSSRTRSTC